MLLLQLGGNPSDKALDVSFAQRGIQRTVVTSPGDARAFLKAVPYDFIFVDLDMQGGQGEALVQEIRRITSQTPIFAFTTKTDIYIKIRALDLGADDVLPPHCAVDELLARTRSLMRRLDQRMSSELRFGPVAIDLDRRSVTVNGQALRLSPTEYQMLELLVRRQGRPVPRESCLAYIYAVRSEPDVKAIDVLVWRLRKKLAVYGHASLIKNVWGHGFKLDVESLVESASPMETPEDFLEALDD